MREIKLIIRPMRGGKTTELIKRCAERGGYIVCRSLEEAGRIFGQAKQMGLKIPFPISYDEFVNRKYYGKGVKKFHIDNIDMLVIYISQGFLLIIFYEQWGAR